MVSVNAEPGVRPGTPEGRGQEEALSSRNSFAGMAAPPRLRCSEGLGRQGSAVRRVDGGFRVQQCERNDSHPLRGPRWNPPRDDHLPGDEGLPEGSGVLGEPSLGRPSLAGWTRRAYCYGLRPDPHTRSKRQTCAVVL